MISRVNQVQAQPNSQFLLGGLSAMARQDMAKVPIGEHQIGVYGKADVHYSIRQVLAAKT
jgi:hypothetical protein